MKSIRSPSSGEGTDTSVRQAHASKDKLSVDAGRVPPSVGGGPRLAVYARISGPLRERIVQLAFGSAIAVLLAVGTFAYRSVLASNESIQWVQHTHEVLENLQGSQLGMETISASVRGFVLTGDQAYLERYHAGVLNLVQHEAAVRSLTVDNPNQQIKLPALEALSTGRIQRAETIIGLRQTQGFAAAADAIQNGPGQKATADFEAIIGQMVNEEQRLLAIRNPDSARRILQTEAILLLGTVVGLIITCVAFWLIQRDGSRRELAEKALRDSEEQYRTLVDEVQDYAIFRLDPRGRVATWNAGAKRIKGYSADEIIGREFSCFFTPGDIKRGRPEEMLRLAAASGRYEEHGLRVRKSGLQFLASVTLTALHDVSGKLLGFSDITRDLSESKESAKYRWLLEAAPDAIVVINQSGEIVLLNLQAEKQFGYRRDELVGQKVTNIIPNGFEERLIASRRRSAENVSAQQFDTGLELAGRRKDGSEFPIELMLSPLESVEGILVTAAIRDISAREESEARRVFGAQMAYSAQHDVLTGLPNRMLLSDRIGQAIALSQRHGTKVAVLFLDLNGFKHVNDSLGHSVGDKLLQSVAKCLESCVRASDTVSRVGGDEFVVLLSEVQHAEDVAISARRILAAVAAVHLVETHNLHVKTSIGMSIYPDDGADAETLIKNADTAMYQAKNNGGQSYQFFEPGMNVRAVERQFIEEGLRRALERHEFALHYQPKIDLKTGVITGAEALIRWTHPTRGPISPAKFVPIAEECGLILPIGAWVLREACNQVKAWVDADLPAITMAVNVSASEFRDEKFSERVFAILSETGMNPRYLELELSESALMKNVDATANILQNLRARGVKVAIDDFGTGYSSLSYLRNFPVDALKIDQSFVRQISTAGDDTTIVKAAIGMARSLELRVIAEGVETREEVAFLRASQCDEAQGYFFSPPVLPEQFAKLVRTAIPHVSVPGPAPEVEAVAGRDLSNRLVAGFKKSYLHGFVYFGKAGTAVECVVHDISDSGARIKFLAALPIVDTIELHIPSRGLVHHANILWRAVDEIGVGFMKDTTLPVRYFDGDGVIRRRQSGKQ
jgi:diguanylate cyclase (GGDEF)-like protein/PAS domain S-box-containing protein